ncbi:MAG: YdcF family protein [Clostridia bacterium]|nr:YdcF family protein [Clostridia bacterium]
MVNNAERADHAIVLGLALENGKPTDDLMARLNTAQAYLENYPEAQLILTGGNADGSGRSEAAVMRDILAERGVSDDRMLLEDQSKSTKDNFKNTAQIIDPGKPVVLISSDYHMDRAVQAAKSAGFSDILRLPAPSSLFSYGSNVMSEVVLELNELTLRQ